MGKHTFSQGHILISKENENKIIIYIYIYDYKFTLHVKTQTNKVTGSPDTNISESTWEFKKTSNNNKYIYVKQKNDN